MRCQIVGIVVVVALLGTVAGCMDSAVGSAAPQGPTRSPSVPPAASTARGYLAEPRSFTIMPSSMAQVTARRMYLDQAEETAMLPLVGGEVTVQARAGGMLALTAMTLELGDIKLSSTSVPPTGLTLMAVKLSLKSQADASAEWSADDDAANASARTDLLLDWSIEAQQGSVEPLATQRISNVPLDLAVVEASGGRLTLSLHGGRDGVFWQWSGLMELADLKLDLEAAN